MKSVFGISSLFFLFVVISAAAFAQSSDQIFPTPVRSSEIVSTIKARDIGDSRLTTYYYTFEGEQGDVFMNVQTRNFTGDIDLYVIPGQVPLSKIVIYGDQPETETGRVVYLRKPERLLLRVQGRTPGDDEASIRIKFAGSFAASKLDDTGLEAPTVGSTAETNVRVNSVGTILEVIPKVKPTPAAVAGKVDLPRTGESETKGDESGSVETKSAPDDEKADERRNSKQNSASVEVAATTDPVAEEKKLDPPPRTPSRTTRRRTASAPPKTAAKTPETINTEAEAAEVKKEETPSKAAPANRRTRTRNRAQTKPVAPKPEEPKVDPMANIRLVVHFKDGSTIERPMTEVLRFAVERAVLTIIHKDGTIGRYKMIDVQRVSIE